MSSRSDVTTCTNFDHAPRFVGTLVAVLLTGIFSTQAWSYFVGLKKRQSESKWLQAFVSALVNLISAQVTTSAVLSYYSVLGDDKTHCRFTQSVFCLRLALAGLISAACRLWLLHRVFVVSERNIWATAVGLVLWLTSLVMSATIFALLYIRRDQSWASKAFGIFIPLLSFLSAGLDVYAALAFIIFALRRRQTVKDVRMGRLLTSLAKLTIQACWLPTLSCLICALCLVIAPQGNQTYAAPLACTPVLFGISVLFCLNARDSIQSRADDESIHYTVPTLPHFVSADYQEETSSTRITRRMSEVERGGDSEPQDSLKDCGIAQSRPGGTAIKDGED